MMKRGLLGLIVGIVAIVGVGMVGGAEEGCKPAEVAPAATLGTCEGNLATEKLPLVDFLVQSVLQCSADLLSLIQAIASSSDPAYAQYKSDAQSLKSDHEAFGVMKAQVENRVAAVRAQLAHDAGL